MKRYKRLIMVLFVSLMVCMLTACGGDDELDPNANIKELAEGVLMVIGNESVTYEEAFAYWHKALELDSSYLDAVYSMGFCYEELEQYHKAYKVWSELVRELDSRGLVIEREYPARMAENCAKKVK